MGKLTLKWDIMRTPEELQKFLSRNRSKDESALTNTTQPETELENLPEDGKKQSQTPENNPQPETLQTNLSDNEYPELGGSVFLECDPE